MVDWGYGLDGFEFDDDFAFDQEVGPEAGFDLDGFVDDRDGELTGDVEAALREFVSKGSFVDGFEQPGAQLGVDAIGRVEDLVSDFIFGHREMVGAAGGSSRGK